MSTFRMWEVFAKADEGAFFKSQNEWLLKVFIPNMKRVIKEHDIKWDKKTIVNGDDALADRLWAAAKDFFISVGVYHQDTHRVMKFSEQEVNEVLYNKVPCYMIGAGHDQRWIRIRKVEDRENRPFHLYSPDANFSTDLHKKACVAYLKEPMLDGLCAPLIEDYMGRKATSHTPTEMAAAMEHAMNLRDAQRLVGRPDVWTVSVGTAETDQAQVAAANAEWGVRPGHQDGRMVSILTEMTTNNSMLNKSLHYRTYGNVFGNLCGAIFGGHAGGTEGTAILQTAYNIQGACLYGSCWALNFPFHLKWQSTTTRELLWIQSILSQALSRNSNLIYMNNLFANAGPGTDQLYWECAAHALATESSGGNPWGAATCRNKFTDYATPLESRFYHEVSESSFRMRLTRAQAEELCQKIVAKYEELIPIDNYGKKLQEVYDMDRIVPRQEFVDHYRKMRDELIAMGVEFVY